ncbi:radical SAM/SPASM domain-containing protein [Methanosalsum natronophilum]|uniref:radical SAM/SPASM domain-containing protein n=1 Tax=Methanosalsum natronophilum TaxID=768733 RepID=UPI002166E7FA|nr:radical SAM protein [Methanosalsum natronophilum]MCS3923813.1 MoaA/NifB/PqqE/SkfB family radical SAM enzyme [Methanosalsum natronophilum]
MKYYLYKSPLFKVYAEIHDGLVKIKTKGIGSSLMKPVISEMLDIFDNVKPAKVEDEHLIFSTWMPPIPSTAFSRLVSSQTSSMRGKMVPEQVTISITEDCPNSCVHCALPDTKNKKSLTPDMIIDVINQVIKMGTTLIIFDGGEPLVYDGLESLISHVDHNRAIPTIFTSGTGLNKDKALKLKNAGLYAVNVSLDSAQPAKHDQMRGRDGVYEEAISAINNSLDAGLLVNIYVVLSSNNIDELDDFYDLADSMGVHELSFYEIVPTGRWEDRMDSILSDKDHDKLDEFLERVRWKEGPRVFSIPHAMKSTGCFAGRKWIHVTPEGEVFPCACIPYSFGNIHDKTLDKIWKQMRNDKTFASKTSSCHMRNTEFRENYLGILTPKK